MFYDGGHFMGGIHALWWIFWLVLIGALVFLAFRRSAPARRSTKGRECRP